jgi:alkylation response protein AidB-like acyl-CoA dehydrogenase
MNADAVLSEVQAVAARFAEERKERQRRTALDPADFEALGKAGFLLTGVPAARGGLWESRARSTRVAAELLRTIARGDSSVALVASMHPAVLSFWLASPEADEPYRPAWAEQVEDVTGRAAAGAWWGTITSEPGSGGDVARTRTNARRDGDGWLISGTKHFGSGTGVSSYMITTALAEGEEDPDWFFMDFRGVPAEDDARARVISPWDGHGMTATQSHALAFENFPATRVAWPGNLPGLAFAAGPVIGCLFAAVVSGIVDAAVAEARAQLEPKRETLRPYEHVEWANVTVEAWLVNQAMEGMLRAVETSELPQIDVLRGKTAIAQLAESILTRLCKVLGGGTFSRSSPFGYWFEDVRALGFLRPPWGLAYDLLIAGADIP